MAGVWKRSPGADKAGDPLSGTGDSSVLTPETRLRRLGLTLPEIPGFPAGQEPRLEPFVRLGDVVYLSGIGPLGTTGVVGADLDVAAG